MRVSALGSISAVVSILGLAHCSRDDGRLALIASGDAVRVIPGDVAGCPSGWGADDYDDSAWPVARLPIAATSQSGVCLRKEFNVVADLARYRWLTIRFSGRSRARLNSGKGLTSYEESGIDWSTDDGATPAVTPPDSSREYTLDLSLFPSLLHSERNVLALQVPQSPQPLDIEATLMKDDGTASQFVQVVKGPYRVRPTASSTRIAWESDRSAPSWAIVDGQRYDGGWAMHHEAVVDGLVAGRVYSFHVETAQASALPPECQSSLSAVAPSPDSADEFWKYVQRRDACKRVAAAIHTDPMDLRAAPAPGGHTRLVFVGGTRADRSASHAIVDAAAGEAADLVVHTGDVVATTYETDWQAFFDGARALLGGAPIAAVAGERDVAGWGDRFAQLFGIAVSPTTAHAFALDVGAVHVALLDSTTGLADQAAWLDADLSAAEAAGARHLFVVLHWGPWSAGPTGGNPTARAATVPVLRRHHVEAVISGHDSIYEHGVAGGLHYFVTGGGSSAVDHAGATAETLLARAVPHYLVVDVDGATATVRAKDAAGVVFDQVPLAP